MHIQFRALLFALIIFLIFISLACTLSSKMVELNESSMEPTYPKDAQFRIVEIDPKDLNRGDLVYYSLADVHSIRRLVGLPSETVEIVEGVVYINGTLLEEDYPVNPFSSFTETWTLADDEYFVLGDNRAHSLDSRSYGPIQASAIKGIALPIN